MWRLWGAARRGACRNDVDTACDNFAPQTRSNSCSAAGRTEIRRPFHGGSWPGGKESTAGRIWAAVRTTPAKYLRVDHDRFLLVLTEQRMLVLSREAPANSCDRPYHALQLLELPRGTYGLRLDVPGSWFTHRLDLTFGDGSWIALDVLGKETYNQILDVLG